MELKLESFIEKLNKNLEKISDDLEEPLEKMGKFKNENSKEKFKSLNHVGHDGSDYTCFYFTHSRFEILILKLTIAIDNFNDISPEDENSLTSKIDKVLKQHFSY